MVHEAVAAVLGPDVNPDEPLMASGLDSLGAVELRNALQAQIGSELPATLLFDYPSINAVTGFLADQVGADHYQLSMHFCALSPTDAYMVMRKTINHEADRQFQCAQCQSS
jgi:acyl carrier protein